MSTDNIIEKIFPDTLKTLSDLIAFKTVSGESNIDLIEYCEKKLSKLLRVKYVVTATSGTISIFLALKAVGVKENDEVIVPNITFPATANAVKLAGGKVVLVDVKVEVFKV